MPRLPGEGVEIGVDDDGIVHNVVFVSNAYAFKCRKWVHVWDAEGDQYEEAKFFSHSQALTLECDGPVTCFECLIHP